MKPFESMSDNMLIPLVAGSAAGVVQTTVSQPFEFWKTSVQLQGVLSRGKEILPLGDYFTGCSVLNIAAVLKTGVRFGAYNSATRWLRDRSEFDGVPENAQVLMASLFTGTMESLCIVPFESVKTTMVQNTILLNRSAQLAAASNTASTGQVPKTFHRAVNPTSKTGFREPIAVTGMWKNIREMYTSRGLRSYFQGLMPTLFRQMGNSMVRFSTYTTLKQAWLKNYPISDQSDDIMGMYMGVLLGAASSLAVVSLTQPLDVIKTRMQSVNAPLIYKNSINCAYQIFIKEGIPTFWRGSLPRLLKVGLSGGISFGIYEYVENLMHSLQRDGYLK